MKSKMGSLSNLCKDPESKTKVLIATRNETRTIYGQPCEKRSSKDNVIVPLVWPNMGAILKIVRTVTGYEDIYRALLPDPQRKPTKLPFGCAKLHPVTETMVLLRE